MVAKPDHHFNTVLRKANLANNSNSHFNLPGSSILSCPARYLADDQLNYQTYPYLASRKVCSPAKMRIATEDDVQVPLNHLYGKDILARRLETIYWANYFGPNYLNPETEALFLNAPVGIIKLMAGGIWYQLHEEFETVPWQEAERIEE